MSCTRCGSAIIPREAPKTPERKKMSRQQTYSDIVQTTFERRW